MENHQNNKHVKHPNELKRELKGISKFNDKLAVKITIGVGSMWSAYVFAVLSITSLPAILVALKVVNRNHFPHFILQASYITLIAWISQNFLQLVLLPIIMVGQNVIQGQQEAKAEADHHTLTYLANLQEQQMTELKNQAEILDYLKKKVK